MSSTFVKSPEQVNSGEGKFICHRFLNLVKDKRSQGK